MVDWSTINPVLISVFTEIAREPEAPEWSSQWKEAAAGADFINPAQQGAVYLKVTSCVGVGEDEQRHEEEPAIDGDGNPTTTLYDLACGLRRFTLQVQAESTEHTDDFWAFALLEKIRTRLNWERIAAKLLDVDTVVTDILPAQKVTVTKGKRRVSIGTMDVIFTCAINDQDTVPVGWIERVRLTSEAQENDVTLGSPPNVIDELLPPEE